MKAPTYNNETRYMEDIHEYQAFGLVELVMETLLDEQAWCGEANDDPDAQKLRRILFLKFKEALTRSYWDNPYESN